ncbi:M20 metallopeptidase family protein [Ureibacillus aquaedulcis]|uniref:M20 family metallopeptidase n=1 Tax=Ureibacillus aquaedulcis TaxID=3058421 RepID=A0ABT8GRP3_9BACL|nr:M20 family metallopeptidase [Ureibacillus sp. BA0131]MDN4494073.1 M20 family metallopeptidase [Ureibacillus sp. BA0131]
MEKENLQLVTDLRHELHTHPELSYEEVWTRQRLINFLKEHTNNLEIVDEGKKYFYAAYRGAGEGKKNIAFRADFDALPIPETIDLPWGSTIPGVAHKCGHDGHSSSLVGFALEVDQKGADQNIFFLFQHAEETAQGAIEAREILQKEKIDEIYGFHNMPGIPLKTVSVIDGTAHFASRGMSIEMIGFPSHASEPEKGINPSYAIAKIIDAIPEFTSSRTNEGLVLCTVIQIDVGSENYGIAAHRGALKMTIRAEKETELDQLQKNLENLAKQLSEQQGIQVSFKYNDIFPETVNTKECSDVVRKVCEDKGLPWQELPEPYRASEDFGEYLKQVQGSFFYVGSGEDHPGIHTLYYDFPDEIIETVVEVYKGIAGTK